VARARRGHGGERGGGVAETRRGEPRRIALVAAGLWGGAPPPQAGRGRDTHAPRQLDICDTAVVLQLLENLSVDGIETGRHGRLRNRFLARALLAMPARTAKHYCSSGNQPPSEPTGSQRCGILVCISCIAPRNS